MLEYWIEKRFLDWFNKPERPLPPLYRRYVGSTNPPALDTPCGPSLSVNELVILTPEQQKVYFSS